MQTANTMVRIYNILEIKERRRELRKDPTKQESTLWYYLRGKKTGYKFRRQHSIGGYILDFCCLEKKLIIELDGAIHNTNEARLNDEVRDKYFTDIGYKVLRFSNDKIDKNINEVLGEIKSHFV